MELFCSVDLKNIQIYKVYQEKWKTNLMRNFYKTSSNTKFNQTLMIAKFQNAYGYDIAMWYIEKKLKTSQYNSKLNLLM